ncbi:hypothetical protein AABD61_08400 [Edwardsiella piscicida]|uniref:hypothetical protein n=1 Tax=Edwardsiella piscicida TaxID=1263550 RepID=UPI00370D3A33
MIQWLNEHVGTDFATYFGIFLAVIGLVAGGGKIYVNKTIKNKTTQSVINNSGHVSMAGHDIVNTINNYSVVDEKVEALKKNNAHDVKIIEEILTLLPYEETVHYIEKSYLVGMPLDLSTRLDSARRFLDEKYTIFNPSLNEAKNKFIESIDDFYSVILEFLFVDHPEREPLRLDLPYDWKCKGEESENIYLKHQSKMRSTGDTMVNYYKDLVRVFNEQGLITDKL